MRVPTPPTVGHVHCKANSNGGVGSGGSPKRPAHPARDDDVVLASLAAITRELGHYPTISELRLKRQHDGSLPFDPNVVQRLGKKADVIAQLHAWTTERPEWADVAELLDVDDDTNYDTDAASVEPKAGYVYLLHSSTRGHKIGMTTSMPRRWSEIEGADPGDVELVHHFKTIDAPGIEAYWHRRFDARRKERGEWFALRSADVTEFKRRSRSM